MVWSPFSATLSIMAWPCPKSPSRMTDSSTSASRASRTPPHHGGRDAQADDGVQGGGPVLVLDGQGQPAVPLVPHGGVITGKPECQL